MTTLTYCQACDDDGWCEDHSEAVVVRQGASARTADELVSVFVHDAIALGAELAPWGTETLRAYDDALEAQRDPLSGVAWLPDDDSGYALADDMATLRYQIESELDTLDYVTEWNDGFVIYGRKGGAS